VDVTRTRRAERRQLPAGTPVERKDAAGRGVTRGKGIDARREIAAVDTERIDRPGIAAHVVVAARDDAVERDPQRGVVWIAFDDALVDRPRGEADAETEYGPFDAVVLDVGGAGEKQRARRDHALAPRLAAFEQLFVVRRVALFLVGFAEFLLDE